LIRSMLTKKRALVALSVVGVLAIAITAFAYWTTSGSGSVSATAGSDAGVSVSGDPANGIYPGGSVPVTTTVTNSSASQTQFVTNLHVTISIDAAHAGNGCLASWFTYKADSQGAGTDANPRSVALNTELAASGNTTVDGHVFMSDPNTNQDACKGATIDLAYAVDNS
jgi:flagellar capping protein FliD